MEVWTSAVLAIIRKMGQYVQSDQTRTEKLESIVYTKILRWENAQWFVLIFNMIYSYETKQDVQAVCKMIVAYPWRDRSLYLLGFKKN